MICRTSRLLRLLSVALFQNKTPEFKKKQKIGKVETMSKTHSGKRVCVCVCACVCARISLQQHMKKNTSHCKRFTQSSVSQHNKKKKVPLNLRRKKSSLCVLDKGEFTLLSSPNIERKKKKNSCMCHMSLRQTHTPRKTDKLEKKQVTEKTLQVDN